MPVLKTSFSQKIKVAGEKEKTGFELIGVAELLSPLLLAYLQSRQINLTVARHYLKQVCFKPLSQTASHKTYTALGFPSNDGFEVRNSRFKSFVGSHKTITALNLKNGKSLSIFEGFMDFLAFLSYRSITNFQNSVIILNSVSGRKQALEVIRWFEFSKVYLFLDNDQAGLNTTQFFMANIKNIPISDKSNLYRGYKDLNEWLIHQTSSQQKNQKRT